MSNLIFRMEQLREERADELAALKTNTIEMQAIVREAYDVGHGTRAIAGLLGVTTKTVYSWLGR